MGSKDTGLHHIIQFFLAGTVEPHGDEDRQHHGQSHKQHCVDHRIGQHLVEGLVKKYFLVIVHSHKFFLCGDQTSGEQGTVDQVNHRINREHTQQNGCRRRRYHSQKPVSLFTCASLLFHRYASSPHYLENAALIRSSSFSSSSIRFSLLSNRYMAENGTHTSASSPVPIS